MPIPEEKHYAPVGAYNFSIDENGLLTVVPTYRASRTVLVAKPKKYINPEFIVTPTSVKPLVDDTGTPAYSVDAYNIVLEDIPLNPYQYYMESKGVAPKDVEAEHLIQRYRADQAADRADLAPLIGNLISGGYVISVQEGLKNLKNGNYFGLSEILSPLMLGENAWNKIAQGIYGGIHLLNENGVPKTWEEIKKGNYGRAALSGAGDLFNLTLAGVGGNLMYKSTLELLAARGNNWARAKLISNELNKLNPNISSRYISSEHSVDPISGSTDLQYTLYDEFGNNMGSGWMAGVDNGGRYVNGIKSTNIGKGVTEDIYNTVVTDTPDGLRSGVTIMYSPLKTLRVVRGKMQYVPEGYNEEGLPISKIIGPSRKPLPLRVEGNHIIEINSPENEVFYNETTGLFETKQPRMFEFGDYPIYTGPKHSISEIVNIDGTVNPRAAMQILHEVANYFKLFGKGAYKMEERLENPEWHTLDPNTYLHTKNVALTAYQLPTPPGFTKQDLIIAALGHDFGKIISGNGHEEISASLIKQIFPDATPEQIAAIAEHIQSNPLTILGQYTKAADIINGRGGIEVLLDLGEPDLYNIIVKPSKTTIGPVRGIEGTPVITEENAHLITPEQWTAAQDAAITRGDTAEAQRLRDLHFRVYAPDTKMVDVNGNPIHNYHGSNNKNITVFREKARPIRFFGKNRIGIYFTGNKKRASEFTSGKNRKIYDTYLNLTNPYIQSYRQTVLNNLRNLNPFKKKHYFTSEYIITDDLNSALKGYDGAITEGTENVALKSNQIKLADAITYDNNGIRIPLGERDNFMTGDIRYFSGPSEQLAFRPVNYLSTNPQENPLLARMMRLSEKRQVGDVAPNLTAIFKLNVSSRDIVRAVSENHPELNSSQIELITQTLMNNKRGAHIPIGNNAGETTGGISIVEVEDAINYLKSKGIKNPTERDIRIILGHELGHGVKLTPEALNAVRGYEAPEEFYTQIGQVLDNAGITNTLNMPVQFNDLLKLGEKYLAEGNLDNGVSKALNFLKRFKGNSIKDIIKQQYIMSLINRFSVGILGIYTGSQLANNNGKVL